MKLTKYTGWVLGTALLSAAAYGAGFGLYEMDAASTAMGGHVVAKPRNASANYYNPAGLSNLTGTWVSVGATLLNPPYDVKLDGQNIGKQSDLWFCLPTVFLSQELPWGFAAGLGFYPDYGLGSRYDPGWKLANDSFETLFEGYCLNPNISYRILDNWKVGLGLRAEYVHFMTRTMQSSLGELKLDANNNVGYGFHVGTIYDVFDNFQIGAVYKSRIRSEMKGRATWEKYEHESIVSDHLTLPPSVTLGFNWDKAFWWEPFHFSGSVTWTGWSTMDSLSFYVWNPLLRRDIRYDIDMEWHNAYRAGVGFGIDVTDWLEFMWGYVYDWDPLRSSVGLAHTMLPAGDRHNIYFGPCWKITENLDLAVTYGVIILVSCTNQYADFSGKLHEMHSHSAFTQCIAATLTYHF